VALMKLSKYRNIAYTVDSRPAMATLRKNIHRIPGGQVIDGRYWVDMDQNEQQTHLRAKIVTNQRELSQDPLLHGLI